MTGQRVDWSSLPQGNLHIVVYAVDDSGYNPVIYDNYYTNDHVIKKFNSDKNVNSNYDRNAAYRYMIKYGNYAGTDCKRNPYYKDTDNDCTNFASQVLGDSNAGKLPQINGYLTSKLDVNNWYYGHLFGGQTDVASYTWGKAEGFREHWGGTNGCVMHAYAYIEYKSIDDVIDDFDYLYNILKPGDVFQIINTTEGAHHTMVVEKRDQVNKDIIYCQHQGDKKDLSLKSVFPRWKTDPDISDNRVDFILISK